MAVDLTGRNGWCYAKQSNKKSDYRICASAICYSYYYSLWKSIGFSKGLHAVHILRGQLSAGK